MPQSARGGRACQGRPRTSSGILRLTARSTSSGPGGALALVTSGEPRTSFSLQAACINTKNSFSSDRSFEICSLAVLNGSLLKFEKHQCVFLAICSPCQLRPWHRFVSKLPADPSTSAHPRSCDCHVEQTFLLVRYRHCSCMGLSNSKRRQMTQITSRHRVSATSKALQLWGD